MREEVFVLLPCRLRRDRLVPQKGQPAVTLEWDHLVQLLAPSESVFALRNLRMLRTGLFVGLYRDPRTGKPVNFLLANKDRSNRFGWFVKRLPNFAECLMCVFRVESVQLSGQIDEARTREE